MKHLLVSGVIEVSIFMRGYVFSEKFLGTFTCNIKHTENQFEEGYSNDNKRHK